jgi:hypothetical protein
MKARKPTVGVTFLKLHFVIQLWIFPWCTHSDLGRIRDPKTPRGGRRNTNKDPLNRKLTLYPFPRLLGTPLVDEPIRFNMGLPCQAD